MAAPKGNKNAIGNSGGKTKYKPAYCNEVKEHMALGYSLTTWGGTVGVCRETCYNWAKEYIEFFNAIKIGRAKGQRVWEDKLMKQADTGGGNTAATIFAMKNLYRDDWADKIVQEHTGGIKVEKIVREIVRPNKTST